MKTFLRIAAFVLMLMLFSSAAFAAPKATPTPPPIAIETTLVEPPAQIQQMLDIAYNEWREVNGQKLPDINKYTKWRNNYKWEWCAGFVTWALLEAGVPMEELADIREKEDENDHWHVDGLYHVKEGSPGKLVRGYQIMERHTMVPQKGFIIIYGCGFNKVIHAALVYDVEDLGGGKYRLTTLEGNIKDSLHMFIRDYDMNAEVNTNRLKSTNLSEVPENERTVEGADYTIMDGKPSPGTKGRYLYYVNRFLMPWVPGDPALPTPEPTMTPAPTAEPTAEPTPAPTAEPTAEPTPAPTAEPTSIPTAEPTAEPTATPAPAVTEAPIIVTVTALTPAPTAAPTAEPTAEPTETPAPTPVPTPEPTAEPTPVPDTFPCQGAEGKCPYVTRDQEDPFCRKCDRDDNGVEDSKE